MSEESSSRSGSLTLGVAALGIALAFLAFVWLTASDDPPEDTTTTLRAVPPPSTASVTDQAASSPTAPVATSPDQPSPTTVPTPVVSWPEVVVVVEAGNGTFDPQAAVDGRDLDVVANLYSGLTRRVLEPSLVDRGLFRWSPTEVEGDLAETIEVSDDGLVYTFRLREGLRFPSGNPLTAGDFAYAWGRAMAIAETEGSPGPTVRALAAAGIHNMSQVRALDDHALEIRPAGPNPRLLQVMAMGVTSAVDSVLLASQATDSQPWATEYSQLNPVGYGPYQLVEGRPGGDLILEPNEAWWDPATRGRSRIVLRVVSDEAERLELVQQGSADLAHNMSAMSVEGVGDSVRVVALDSYDQRLVAFDTTRPPFDDVRVRQAVAWALYPDRIFQEVYAGHARLPSTLLPADFREGAATWPYSHDLDLAGSLLAEAGFLDGFSVEMLVSADLPEGPALAERIRGDLALIGVDAYVHSVSGVLFAAIMDDPDRSYNMAVTECATWLPEIWYVTDLLTRYSPDCPIALPTGGVATLLDGMEESLSADNTLDLAERIEAFWTEEAAFIPLAQPDQIEIMNPDLSGFVLTNEADALYFPLLEHRPA